MSLTLRAGLSWCICARQAVFLDLPQDRYFCLPDGLDGLFQRWASGETIDALSGDALITAGVAKAGSGSLPMATEHPIATRDLASGTRSQSLRDTLGAITGHLRARRRLRRHSLVSLMTNHVAAASDLPVTIHDEGMLRRIAGAFATSAIVLRAADQCLPRAIAARRLCRKRRQDVALIFGVRLHPFAAHSWVQAGHAVVVGDLEQVRLYTPILVVR
ncbi:lasso peptide biosynthesis B2 protein [Sphingomonas qomolangmaensis]|uniref:Lasso peptide biosynthesis B2 protein n=1 Tax=Sphingomonas qomolangmaensis TaxID=2918765 RepID=A0ABY5L9P2_9SPHN|nr:lasso peptide biosynthesis B2 protein [Sphingomonas qomolangmaensis]UUL82519.1 lasso peptide biosynthesis B2 protein [Sphingomonas qomolangmaensis]